MFRLHFEGGRGAIAHAGAAGGKGYDAEQGACARECVCLCVTHVTSLLSPQISRFTPSHSLLLLCPTHIMLNHERSIEPAQERGREAAPRAQAARGRDCEGEGAGAGDGSKKEAARRGAARKGTTDSTSVNTRTHRERDGGVGEGYFLHFSAP